MDTIEHLDWILERLSVHPEIAFRRLASTVEGAAGEFNRANTRRAQAVYEPNSDTYFSLTMSLDGRRSNGIGFRLAEGRIEVVGLRGQTTFSGRPCLLPSGHRRFELQDGTLLTEWQFVGRALEPMLFEG